MAIQEDEKKRFLEAYDAYADAIFRYCSFRVPSRVEAEELTQETFMKTWKYMADGGNVENIRAFLYRVAANGIIDAARKKKEQSLDMLMEKTGHFEPAYDTSRAMENELLAGDIQVELASLSHEDQDIIVKRYIEDLSPEEIADTLDITANNASVRLNRAIKRLRKHLNKKGMI